MRLPMLETIQDLAQTVEIELLYADQLSDLSEELRGNGDETMADEVLTTVRHHRVAALRAQGQLQALKHRYKALYHDDG